MVHTCFFFAALCNALGAFYLGRFAGEAIGWAQGCLGMSLLLAAYGLALALMHRSDTSNPL